MKKKIINIKLPNVVFPRRVPEICKILFMGIGAEVVRDVVSGVAVDGTAVVGVDIDGTAVVGVDVDGTAVVGVDANDTAVIEGKIVE